MAARCAAPAADGVAVLGGDVDGAMDEARIGEEPCTAKSTAALKERLANLDALGKDALRGLVVDLVRESHSLHTRVLRGGRELQKARNRIATLEAEQGRVESTGSNIKAHELEVEDDVHGLMECVDRQEHVVDLQQQEIDVLHERLREANRQIQECSAREVAHREYTERLRAQQQTTFVAVDKRSRGSVSESPDRRALPRDRVSLKTDTVSLKTEDPLVTIAIHVMPGAYVANSVRTECVRLQVRLSASGRDVQQMLARSASSLAWDPLRQGEPDTQGIEDARLILRGMPLKLDACLRVQGIRDGSELRLLRPRCSAPGLRSRDGGRELVGAPRGLLAQVTTERWNPTSARHAGEDFFSRVSSEHVSHLEALSFAKTGQVKKSYLTH